MGISSLLELLFSSPLHTMRPSPRRNKRAPLRELPSSQASNRVTKKTPKRTPKGRGGDAQGQLPTPPFTSTQSQESQFPFSQPAGGDAQGQLLTPPFTPTQPQESQFPFSQPAGVVQAAPNDLADDDLIEVEDDDEEPPASAQRPPSARNLQFGSRPQPPRLRSESPTSFETLFDARWRVFYTAGPGKNTKPLPGWRNSKWDTRKGSYQVVKDWVTSVVAMQASPMKQMDLQVVIYPVRGQKKYAKIESLHGLEDLHYYTRWAVCMELVNQLAYEHPNDVIQVDFDLTLMPDTAAILASATSTVRQEAQVAGRVADLDTTTVQQPSENVRAQLREVREPSYKRKNTGNTAASRDFQQLNQTLSTLATLVMAKMVNDMGSQLPGGLQGLSQRPGGVADDGETLENEGSDGGESM
ncbi:hypothetical protein HBH98_067200 [Parastagonospora nodorum]|nr:hypothetical protein HBH53_054360 [Parastagonospora nodorum]KAH3981851.1 hypothetical protein HBH51_040790 [Parastagonospora nodorum]KAH4024475.1 hypothetical protein HBI09_161250 [Parastagonospora nodorum]KAH4069588.1 hypothetical protein HBH50_101090 [Parastagonospora nodorum]KAH4089997.1 hypothetical protein HBH48_104870 [Parastagonospora nodorum]